MSKSEVNRLFHAGQSWDNPHWTAHIRAVERPGPGPGSEQRVVVRWRRRHFRASSKTLDQPTPPEHLVNKKREDGTQSTEYLEQLIRLGGFTLDPRTVQLTTPEASRRQLWYLDADERAAMIVHLRRTGFLNDVHFRNYNDLLDIHRSAAVYKELGYQPCYWPLERFKGDDYYRPPEPPRPPMKSSFVDLMIILGLLTALYLIMSWIL